MILTAIFNVIQNGFSIMVAYILYKKIKSRTG